MTKIERLLNVLVQTNKMWDYQAMQDRVKSVYLLGSLAIESGGESVPWADLTQEYAADLKQRIEEDKQAGQTYEFRNLCIRSVEIMRVCNYADSTANEFLAKLSYHAQTTIFINGKVTSHDADVVSSEEYVLFGREDMQWKLKQVLTTEEGQKQAAEENIDEGSSPEQLAWFYAQERAI